MCFLKTFKQLDAIPFQKSPETEESDFNENGKEGIDSMAFAFSFESKPFFFPPQQETLRGLVSLLQSNSQKLTILENDLNNSQRQLDSFFQELEHPHLLASQCQISSELSSDRIFETQEESGKSDGEMRCSGNPLVEQLFGKKKYSYKLRLVDEFPETIFKERNINVAVELVTFEGEKVRNSNILHLCLGVVDGKGEWITENKAKESFMKGKTEVELYHGEGSFQKVYPRQVSRNYSSGKLNFLIYPKPSVLRFSSNNSCLEEQVNSNKIEPLLISDISIKAKKKE